MSMKKYVCFSFAAFAAFSLWGAAAEKADSPKEPEGYTQNKYSDNMEDLSAVDFDDNKLPHYTGTVFPEAQNAVYSDKFIPLKEVSIVLGPDIKKDDLRVAILERKLNKWGVKAETVSKPDSKKVQILLNVPGAGKPAPDKSEGYSISCSSKDGKDIIAVNGKDKRGLLWGIVSVLQLTKHDTAEISFRSAEINDYPDTSIRGFLTLYWAYAYETAIFCKMNCVIMQTTAWTGDYWSWRTPGPPVMSVMKNGEILHELGLDFYARSHFGISKPKLISCNEKDFQQAKYVIERYYASKNINLYFAYDDDRYPLPEQDKAKFGSAAEADAYFVNRLYREVKKDYPNFKMVFCPPYYWTIGINRDAYHDSGLEYVKTIGAKLDKEIGLYWTGVHVVEIPFYKNDVAQITEWFNRKPWIFKNRPGVHMAVRSLPGDITVWGKGGLSYDGFADDIEAITLNTSGACHSALTASLCDYLWNIKGYNAERSAEKSASLLLGSDLYPYLKTFNDKMKIFDVYAPPTGLPRPSDVSALNIKMLEETLADAKKAYDEICKRNPGGISGFSNGELLVWADAFVKASRDPKLLTANPVKDIAKKETPLAPKDIFISPDALSGKVGTTKATSVPFKDKRPAKVIYPAKTKFPTLTLPFINCNPYPASNDWQLYISGALVADENTKDCRLIIKFNDKVIYDGMAGFSKENWTVKQFKIPLSYVQKSDNVVTISNGADTDSEKSPLIYISYAVLERF